MDKIKILENKIKEARQAYYNSSNIISDDQYDLLIDELIKLDPKNEQILYVGAEPVSKWEKYEHRINMGSLNKSKTLKEYSEWHNKYIEKNEKAFLTLKLDGLSVAIIYEKGKLSKGVTRGSNKSGEIITSNIIKMSGVPLKLKNKIDITIRGEICLSKENHLKYFPTYSNPRNAASGISRRYDGIGSEYLDVLSYSVVSDDVDLDTYEKQFLFLKENDFITPDYFLFSTIEEVNNKREEYKSSLRDKYNFDLDGLVIHNNNFRKIEILGNVGNNPLGSIAFKFDSVAAMGTIKSITCQVGNSGRVTPVATFDPKIPLMGADVERASLHNFANVQKLKVDVGAQVMVCRANDVVPFVKETIFDTGTIFPTPTNCPICNSTLVVKGEYIQCENTLDCPAQQIGRLTNWITNLDIKEFGESLLSKLSTHKVKSVADLYKLTIDDLASIDRMGKKSAKRCYDELHKVKDITLDVFIGGLSIPLIGSSTVRLLMSNGLDTLDKLMNCKQHHFEEINGMGPSKAASLYVGLHQHTDLINELLNFITIKAPSKGALSKMSICITGSTNIKRSELEKMIIDAGGDVKSSVSKGLTLLVISDPSSQSSKAVSARKLGTKLISEQELLEMIK